MASPSCFWCDGVVWRRVFTRACETRWWECQGCGAYLDFMTGAYVAPRRLN